MAWIGVAPGCATYQTPSPSCENGAPDVTHMPPRASKVTFVAYGMPVATSCPGGAGGGGACALAAGAVAAATTRTARRALRHLTLADLICRRLAAKRLGRCDNFGNSSKG